MQQKRDPFEGQSYVERLTQQDPGLEEEAPRKRVDRRPRAMTYRIGDELVSRINEIAEKENVEKSGLVRALLTHALDDLDDGKWALPVPQKPRKLV